MQYGAAAPAYNPAYSAINDKIVKLLGGAGSGNFREAIKPFFDQEPVVEMGCAYHSTCGPI